MNTPATPITAIAPVIVNPVFDSKTAKPVPFYCHEKTQRTVGFHQENDEATTHLFSATGVFIATIPLDEAIANEPKPAKPAAPAV